MTVFLIILGVLLLVVEAFIPLFGIIGLFGLALILTGGFLSLNASFGFGSVFAVSFLVALVIGGGAYYAYGRYRAKTRGGKDHLIGKTAIVVEWEGKQGRVRIGETAHHAFSDHALDLGKNDIAHVVAVEDLSVKIAPVVPS